MPAPWTATYRGTISKTARKISEYGSTIRTILPHMVKRIVEHANPVSVWLFGSIARGECNKHSDVDLMVIVPEGTDRWTATLGVSHAVINSPLPKDIVVDTPERFERMADSLVTMQHRIRMDGVMLYG